MGVYPYTPTPTNTNTQSPSHTHAIQEVRKTPLRNGAAVRRERLQMIIEMARREPGIRITKIQVLMAMRTGLTKKRISQYVRELVEGELLLEDDGHFKVARKR